MEEEPTTLERAMEITGKKEKVMNLMKENKGKGSTSREKQLNLDVMKNQSDNNYNNYHDRNHSIYNRDKNNLNKYNNFNYNNQNKNYLNNQNKNYFDNKNNYNKPYNNNEQNNNNYYNRNKSLNESNNNQKFKLSNDEINEITKRLSDLKISFCVNCMKIGHCEDECKDNEISDDYLN